MISASIAAVIFVVSFLLGSIPNGVIVGKVVYHTDIRTVGSGNIGTTNAIRALGRKGGYASLFSISRRASPTLYALCECGGHRFRRGRTHLRRRALPGLSGRGFGAYLQPLAQLQGRQGHCGLRGRHVRDLRAACGAYRARPVRRRGGGDQVRLGRIDRRSRPVPLHGPLGLLGRLDGGGRLRHHGGRGHLGAPRQYRSPARRHRAPHRPSRTEGPKRNEKGSHGASSGRARGAPRSPTCWAPTGSTSTSGRASPKS